MNDSHNIRLFFYVRRIPLQTKTAVVKATSPCTMFLSCTQRTIFLKNKKGTDEEKKGGKRTTGPVLVGLIRSPI